MKKYVFTEIEPEAADFSSEFDGDMFNENSGDYNNTLFIITEYRGRKGGYNIDEYETISGDMKQLFYYMDNKEEDCTYKEIMQDFSISYNPTKCNKLKKLCQSYYNEEEEEEEIIAEYLTIKTGKKWNTLSVYGYCQGDYATVICCQDNHTEEIAKREGNLYLGAGKEFSLTEYNEQGGELETIYGYFVADNEYRTNEELKNKLCEYEGIEPENCTLKLITNTYTYTTNEYEEI